MLRAPDRNAGVRQVGNLRHHTSQFFLQLCSELLLALAFFAKRLRLFHQRGCVFARTLAPPNFFRFLVALRFKGFGSSNCLPPTAVEIAKSTQQFPGIHPALPQLLFHFGQVLPNVTKIEHRRLMYRISPRRAPDGIG